MRRARRIFGTPHFRALRRALELDGPRAVDVASSRGIAAAPWRLKAADLTVGKRLCDCRLQPSQTGGDLRRPLSAGSRARRSLRVLWRERPPAETPSLPGLRPARGRSRHSGSLRVRSICRESTGGYLRPTPVRRPPQDLLEPRTLAPRHVHPLAPRDTVAHGGRLRS